MSVGTVSFTVVDVDAIEMIRGETRNAVQVELTIPWRVESSTDVARMADLLPKGEVLLFLRHKQDGVGGYRLVNRAGLWSENKGGLRAPLADAQEGARLGGEVATIASVVQLAEYVRK